jgi:hypothetical protein
MNNLEWKTFFMWGLCCPKVQSVSEIWGVMFLMVPPKDKFAHLQNKQVKDKKCKMSL